jgi:hypothetical protein
VFRRNSQGDAAEGTVVCISFYYVTIPVRIAIPDLDPRSRSFISLTVRTYDHQDEMRFFIRFLIIYPSGSIISEEDLRSSLCVGADSEDPALCAASGDQRK